MKNKILSALFSLSIIPNILAHADPYIHYSRINYMVGGISHMRINNLRYMKKVVELLNFKNLINNHTSATKLKDTPIDRSKIYNTCDYNLAFRTYNLPVGTEELSNVITGQAFLRVNESKNVFYTVSKSNDEYVFTAFHMVYDENLNDIRTCLLSRWKTIKIPNISFFKNIKLGHTDSSEIEKQDLNFNLYKNSDRYISRHIFDDLMGSIAYIHYQKHSDEKLCVHEIEWESNGWNVLPYLLPVDKQLLS